MNKRSFGIFNAGAVVVLCGIFGFLKPGAAIATQPCTAWRAPEILPILQVGQALHVYLKVNQSGENIKGVAQYTQEVISEAPLFDLIETAEQRGSFDGTISGNNFNLNIYWNNGAVGVYSASIGQGGRLEGTTHDRRKPQNKVYWYSLDTLDCIGQAAVNSTTAAKSTGPVKSLGRKKTANNSASCKTNYVWRVARADDLVCVTPESRTRVASESQNPESRWVADGDYGPQTCVSGLVWREAFEGDTVCVTPEIWAKVQEENIMASSRRIGN